MSHEDPLKLAQYDEADPSRTHDELLSYINLKNVKDGTLTKKSAEQAGLSYLTANRMMEMLDYDRYMDVVFPKVWKNAKPKDELMPAKDYPDFLQRLQAAM